MGVVGRRGVKLLLLTIAGGASLRMMEESEELLDASIVKLRAFEEKNEAFEAGDWGSKIVTKRSKIILRPIERFEMSWKRRSRPNFEIERPKRLESIPSMVVRRS